MLYCWQGNQSVFIDGRYYNNSDCEFNYRDKRCDQSSSLAVSDLSLGNDFIIMTCGQENESWTFATEISKWSASMNQHQRFLVLNNTSHKNDATLFMITIVLYLFI